MKKFEISSYDESGSFLEYALTVLNKYLLKPALGEEFFICFDDFGIFMRPLFVKLGRKDSNDSFFY